MDDLNSKSDNQFYAVHPVYACITERKGRNKSERKRDRQR